MTIGFQYPFSGNLYQLEKRMKIARARAAQIYARGKKGVDKSGVPYPISRVKSMQLAHFQSFMKMENVFPFVVHAPYAYNLSQDYIFDSNHEQIDQVQLLVDDFDFCHTLGAHYYVIQPGYHKNRTPEDAKKAFSYQLSAALQQSEWKGKVLVKNMAGAGTEIASNINEWAEIIGTHPRIEGALDCARLYASGVPFYTSDELSDLQNTIEKTIGFDRIALLYVNDSNRGCGSRKNNFVRLGEGMINYGGYEKVLTHPSFRKIPIILEYHSATKPSHYDESVAYLADLYREGGE